MKDVTYIKEKIKTGENERVEFKTRWIDSRGLKRLLIAFANTNGGIIIFGIEDDGKIVGIERKEKQELRIKEIASKECTPAIDYEFYYLEIEGKVVAIVEIKKSKQIHSVKDNEIYIRVGLSTPKLLQTTLSNGTKIFTESGNSSYLIDFNIPDTLHPGQEKVIETLKLAKHKNSLNIKFHWGDNSIKVVGAHMVESNVFEFPASEKVTSWYLKFCVPDTIHLECDKEVYISVEEVFKNEKIRMYSRILAFVLIGLSFVPLVFSLIDFFTSDIEQLKIVYGPLSIPLPIITILSLIILNKRITVIIKRLSNIKLTINTKFIEKGVTNPHGTMLKTLKIRFDNQLKNKYAP
jgi:hypothetical protein